MQPQPVAAFTLIELLVVVTIIVVLLALLAPSLDQAIYQAEMTACATRLKGIATGAQVYGTDNKRWYPQRPGMQSAQWRPNQIANVSHTFDDRPPLRGYLSLGLLLDPMAPKGISLEPRDTDLDSEVWSNYQLWFGFQYRQSNVRKKGLFRMGDRFEWDGGFYSLLASDQDMIDHDSSRKFGWGTHPDKEGLWVPQVQNNVLNSRITTIPVIQEPVSTDKKYVQSRWVGTDMRGPLDMNFAYDDGSVQKYNNVKVDDRERMDHLPEYSDGSLWPTRSDTVPIQ